MYTSLTERIPGAGRHENFSAGVASASASNCPAAWLNSAIHPLPSNGGAFCAHASSAARDTPANNRILVEDMRHHITARFEPSCKYRNNCKSPRGCWRETEPLSLMQIEVFTAARVLRQTIGHTSRQMSCILLPI